MWVDPLNGLTEAGILVLIARQGSKNTQNPQHTHISVSFYFFFISFKYSHYCLLNFSALLNNHRDLETSFQTLSPIFLYSAIICYFCFFLLLVSPFSNRPADYSHKQVPLLLTVLGEVKVTTRLSGSWKMLRG